MRMWRWASSVRTRLRKGCSAIEIGARIRWRRRARIAVVLAGAALLGAAFRWFGPGAPSDAAAAGPAALVHAGCVIQPRPNTTDGRRDDGRGVAFIPWARWPGIARSGAVDARTGS